MWTKIKFIIRNTIKTNQKKTTLTTSKINQQLQKLKLSSSLKKDFNNKRQFQTWEGGDINEKNAPQL